MSATSTIGNFWSKIQKSVTSVQQEFLTQENHIIQFMTFVLHCYV